MKTALRMMLTVALLFSVNNMFAQQNVTPAHAKRPGMGQGQKQAQATPEQKAKIMTKRFETNLGLSAEQSAKIQKIFEDNIAKMETKVKAQKELITKNRADAHAQITKILTPEQATKFKEFETKQKSQAARSANNRRPNGSGYHSKSHHRGHGAQNHKMIVVNGQKYIAIGNNMHMSKAGKNCQNCKACTNCKSCKCVKCAKQVPAKCPKAS